MIDAIELLKQAGIDPDIMETKDFKAGRIGVSICGEVSSPVYTAEQFQLKEKDCEND